MAKKGKKVYSRLHATGEPGKGEVAGGLGWAASQ